MKNQYEIRGEITAVFLKHKDEVFEMLIDTNDLPKLLDYPYTWHCDNDSSNGFSYARGFTGKFKGRTPLQARFHRWLLNCPKGMVIDHINHNTLDNRRCNLRIVTHAENHQNRKIYGERGSTSGFRGVGWHKASKKWRARLSVEGKSYYLGAFDDIEEAKRAVSNAREKLMPYSNDWEERVRA